MRPSALPAWPAQPARPQCAKGRIRPPRVCASVLHRVGAQGCGYTLRAGHVIAIPRRLQHRRAEGRRKPLSGSSPGFDRLGGCFANKLS